MFLQTFLKPLGLLCPPDIRHMTADTSLSTALTLSPGLQLICTQHWATRHQVARGLSYVIVILV